MASMATFFGVAFAGAHRSGGLVAMTEAAREVLLEVRKKSSGIGNVPILPTPGDMERPVDRYLLRDWWHRAERLAGLQRIAGRGWHSLRRKFATDLMGEPLKVLCHLGGWKEAETVLTCYQRPDEAAMRDVLAQGGQRAKGHNQGTQRLGPTS